MKNSGLEPFYKPTEKEKASLRKLDQEDELFEFFIFYFIEAAVAMETEKVKG